MNRGGPRAAGLTEQRKEEEMRYTYLWWNQYLTPTAKTIDDMIDALKTAADKLKAMRDAGVVLDTDGGTVDDYANLVTTDPKVAKTFGFEEEEIDEEEEDPDNC